MKTSVVLLTLFTMRDLIESATVRGNCAVLEAISGQQSDAISGRMQLSMRWPYAGHTGHILAQEILKATLKSRILMGMNK